MLFAASALIGVMGGVSFVQMQQTSTDSVSRDEVILISICFSSFHAYIFKRLFFLKELNFRPNLNKQFCF